MCGHRLNDHIEEQLGWRCHSIAKDFLPCECWLRKDKADGNIEYYDCFIRKLRALKENKVDLNLKRNRDLFLTEIEKKFIEEKTRDKKNLLHNQL